MDQPLIVELFSAGLARVPHCVICGAVASVYSLRPDLTYKEFKALTVQVGKGPHCLIACLCGLEICFHGVALDYFPNEFCDDNFPWADEL